jgi:hypothetical protein
VSSNQLLIHGGWNGIDIFDDMWIFDTNSLQWDFVNFSSASASSAPPHSETVLQRNFNPLPRYGHTLTQFAPTKLMLFGGCELLEAHDGIPQYSNDTLFFDLSNFSWNRPFVRGKPPSGRYGHTACLCTPSGSKSFRSEPQDRSILVIGGWGRSGAQTRVMLGDVQTTNTNLTGMICMFDTKKLEWQEVEDPPTSNGRRLTACYNHALAAQPHNIVTTLLKGEEEDYCNTVIIYGGFDGHQPIRDIFHFEFASSPFISEM